MEDTYVVQVITMLELRKFLEEHQGEERSDADLRNLLDRHEPDPTLRFVMICALGAWFQMLAYVGYFCFIVLEELLYEIIINFAVI